MFQTKPQGAVTGAVHSVDWFSQTVSESVKHTKDWCTLWVPGQVVGDGIEEELSCLLPLIVKLLLVTGEQHTPCNVIGTQVWWNSLKSYLNHFKCLKCWQSCSPCGVCLGWWREVQRCRLCFRRMQRSKNKELCSSSQHYSTHQCFCTAIPTREEWVGIGAEEQDGKERRKAWAVQESSRDRAKCTVLFSAYW